MKILALESSAKTASVALCEDKELLVQYYQNSGLTHSRTLLKMAEDLLGNTGMTISELDYIAVASGPGSFTGIRIGVSAAIGLAWGADLPVCGVSTLEAMAYQALAPGYVLCPVMDARRQQVYTASFQYDGACLIRLTPDRAIPVEELLCDARVDRRPFFLIGDGAQMCIQAFLEAGIDAVLAPPLIRLQTAWGVARASLNSSKTTPNNLTPNYLRVSQAERERRVKLCQSD